jgi:hypothetical protein
MNQLRMVQSVLDPAGLQAVHIARLWWLMLVVTTITAVLVLAALAWAVLRLFDSR